MGGAIRMFQQTPVAGSTVPNVSRFIAGGDWNFPVTDPAFGAISKGLGATVTVLPDGLTSLTPNGVTSSSYDHFVWVQTQLNVVITAINPYIVPPPGGKSPYDFRTTFSDHLGIAISVP